MNAAALTGAVPVAVQLPMPPPEEDHQREL